MAEESQEEKSEAPSEKKRQDQRDEGQVAFSREIPAVGILGGFLLFFYFGSGWLLAQFSDLFVFGLRNFKVGDVGVSFIGKYMGFFFEKMGIILFPVFLLIMAVALLTCVLQVGFHITPKPLVPKFSKLNPIKGVGRLFTLMTLKELIKTTLKLILIGYIGYLSFEENWESLVGIFDQSLGQMMREMMEIVGIFVFRLFLAFLVVALFDYGFQKWDFEQKLKMTIKEVKDEHKQVEGDPIVKQRIRDAQRKLSQGRMIQDVPKADVVITNPTHYAVAVQYDRETMGSPRVIAKGADHLALRIIEVAKESRVSVVRNPTLARGMYSLCRIGDEIPEQFFKVMAKILAYVYRQKGRKMS